MRTEKEKFVAEVNSKIRSLTHGPGGSYRLSETGVAYVQQRFERGEFDSFQVADDLLRLTDAYTVMLIADWQDGWF